MKANRHRIICSHVYVSLIWGCLLSIMTPSLAAASIDVSKDVSIGFSSDRSAGEPGYIVGSATNNASVGYACLEITFNLSTRFDLRNKGEKSRRLGTLSAEVRNIGPGASVNFRAELLYPAGFGLKGVYVCDEQTAYQETPPTGSKVPIINSFGAEPARVQAGGWVKFYWDVENAHSVRLFDGYGEIESRISLGKGRYGWPLKMGGSFGETVNEKTVYRLVAKSRSGRISEKRVSVSVKRPEQSASICTVSGKLSGKWHQNVKDRLNSIARKMTVDVLILSEKTGSYLRSASVSSSGKYTSGNLIAGRQYILRPQWEAVPASRTISCQSGKRYLGKNFRITGRPIID